MFGTDLNFHSELSHFFSVSTFLRATKNANKENNSEKNRTF